jgi:hypothetical protein
MGRLLHRALDAAAWAALDRDRDPGRRPTAAKLEGLAVIYDQKPSLVLAELWERQSSKGNAYFSGFMGNVSVALLRDDERPHPTRPGETVTVWKLVAQERDRPPKPRQNPPGRDPGPPGRGNEPRAAGAPPGGSGRPYQHESDAARRERVALEIAREHGLERDPNDPIPF